MYNTDEEKTKVFLIGAGPGDPGLITLKGIECIGIADVVIYDYLASPFLLKHAKTNAELIYAGKKGGKHVLSQDKINDLIINKALEGYVVARLKGGDPFMFGRGGEEAENLFVRGIKFEIVPGVTAAIAVAAYAGIPLTHRRYASDVTFVTGHEDSTKKFSNINWVLLGECRGTIVFFMGVKNLKVIIDNLCSNGKSSDTPIAIVQWGTTSKQITLVGTLATILDQCNVEGIGAPAIIIIGQVVDLRKKMNWFECRPLFGKTILVTRARAQASKMVRSLFRYGADCVEFPTIEIIPPESWQDVDNVIRNIGFYQWIVFTSVNAVDFFFKRFFEIGRDVRVLGHIQTAVIGRVTANRLLKYGLKSDVIPDSYSAESIVSAFKNKDIVDQNVCLPRAMETRPLLPVKLSEMGANVYEVVVYKTVRASNCDVSDIVNKLKQKVVDLITFTSSSTVRNFKQFLCNENLNLLLDGVVIASIGPITAETARNLGFRVDIVATEYTVDGLCKKIIDYYS